MADFLAGAGLCALVAFLAGAAFSAASGFFTATGFFADFAGLAAALVAALAVLAGLCVFIICSPRAGATCRAPVDADSVAAGFGG
ncbi:MAG: hypothetical protein ACYCUX_01255 [Metallibacterium sp.]